MNSFLHSDRPIITAMIKSKSIKDILADIKAAKQEGIDAFGLQVETIAPAERTEKNLKEIFAAMGDKPAYVTDYFKWNDYNGNMSDDELAEEMLKILECGGLLADIRGDLFDPQPEELTHNNTAVKKQIALIDTIHKMGKEVLMSSHVMRFIRKEEVLDIALAHKERNADISKIVTAADTQEELYENYAANVLLQQKSGVRHLFLCNGEASRQHRLVGPSLGDTLLLAVQEGVENTSSQPRIKEARQTLIAAGYKNLPQKEI